MWFPLNTPQAPKTHTHTHTRPRTKRVMMIFDSWLVFITIVRIVEKYIYNFWLWLFSHTCPTTVQKAVLLRIKFLREIQEIKSKWNIRAGSLKQGTHTVTASIEPILKAAHQIEIFKRKMSVVSQKHLGNTHWLGGSSHLLLPISL